MWVTIYFRYYLSLFFFSSPKPFVKLGFGLNYFGTYTSQFLLEL